MEVDSRLRHSMRRVYEFLRGVVNEIVEIINDYTIEYANSDHEVDANLHMHEAFLDWLHEELLELEAFDLRCRDRIIRMSEGSQSKASLPPLLQNNWKQREVTAVCSSCGENVFFCYDGGIVTAEKHKYYDESFLGRKTELSGLRPSEVEDDDDEEKTEENGWTTSHLFCHIECGQRYQPATTGYGVVRLRGDGQLDDDPGSADGDREGNANVAMIAKDDAADDSD